MAAAVPVQEKINRRVQEGKKEHPQYEPFLNFWEKILSLQEAYSQKISSEGRELSPALRDLKLQEGFPLIAWEDVAVDEALMKELLQDLCRATKEANRNLRQEIPKIETWLQNKKNDFSKWITLFIRKEEQPFIQKAKDHGLDGDLMLFLFYAAWKPFLKARAMGIGEAGSAPFEQWARGYCPVCGSMPLISYLKNDGKRVAVCSTCETNYPLNRIFCPHCATTEQHQLRYFYDQGDEGSRIEVCESCRHYLKTIDLRKKEMETLPVLDDLLTTHLDLWAQKKGYKKLPLVSPIIGREGL